MINSATETQETNRLESLGLGRAPFRFSHYERRTYQACHGAPVQPGGRCAACGAGLVHVFWVESSDGRMIQLGEDCVEKRDPQLYASLLEARRYARQQLRDSLRRERDERMAAARDRAAQDYSEMYAMVMVGIDVALASENTSGFARNVCESVRDSVRRGSHVSAREFATIAVAYLAAHLPMSAPVKSDKRIKGLRVRFEGGPIVGEGSAYGPNIMARLRVTEGPHAGAVLVWKTSSYWRDDEGHGIYLDRKVKAGEELTIAATVKRSDSYRGEAQTWVQRVTEC